MKFAGSHKRQSQIEKRFSQLETQFEVAPVFLKSVHRVVALLTVYYLALLVQALLERELRLAMKKEKIASLAPYHEERECKAPTTRRILDLFENVQRHELTSAKISTPIRFSTELSAIQREVVRLLDLPACRQAGRPGATRVEPDADERKLGDIDPRTRGK